MIWNALSAVLLLLAQIGVLTGLFLIGRRMARSKMRLGSAGQIRSDTAGTITIPVHATFTGLVSLSPWVALATNNLNPLLAIRLDGLNYRVVGERTVPFHKIASVEVQTGPGTANLCFVFKEGPLTFSANVGNDMAAAQALAVIPDTVARGPKAAALEKANAHERETDSPRG